MNDSIQYRDFKAQDLMIQHRADQPAVIEGYAALFDSLSEPMFGMREKIASGAFTRALKEKHDVRALVDHDPSKVIGRTKSNTLTLTQDNKGLRVRIEPPNTTAGRDVVESIRRGDIDQMSFGFVILEDRVERKAGPDGEDVRILEDLDLYDVSPVTYPAYADTSVGLRQFRDFAKANQISKLDQAKKRYNNVIA